MPEVKSGFKEHKEEMIAAKAAKKDKPERKIEFILDDDVKASIYYDMMENPKAVAESARAHSYYSISTGTQIGVPSAVPFLTPVSKSVLYTLCSVKKCRIHPT